MLTKSLDTRMAIEVMRWHWKVFPNDADEDDVIIENYLEDNTGMWLNSKNEFFHNDSWSPSTNIKDAFEAIEIFCYYEIKRFGKQYYVYIENNDDARAGIAQENTLSLAICRAALLATE